MTDGKLRVLYNSVNNRSRPVDQKLQLSHNGSGDKNEYITQVIKEEEVIEDSEEDNDHNDGNELVPEVCDPDDETQSHRTIIVQNVPFLVR